MLNNADPHRAADGVDLTPSRDAVVYEALKTEFRALSGDVPHFAAPPVIPFKTAERAGYISSFPHLVGTVYTAPTGAEPAVTDLVLTPAACHHVYPLVEDVTLEEPMLLTVEACCFRGEATSERGRLRSFRMIECVFLGGAEVVAQWRDSALEQVSDWLSGLGLEVDAAPANDPFFGSSSRVMASLQRSEELKWEVLAAVDADLVQAVASVNCHREHFGESFGFRDDEGALGHSACAAVGLDRVLLALRHRHGPDTAAWPRQLTARLGI
jgi:seryl-tRNA synthetase